MAGCGVGFGFGYGYLLLEDLERLEVIAHDAQLFLELDHLTASRALRATCANTSMRLLALPCLASEPPYHHSAQLIERVGVHLCSSVHVQQPTLATRTAERGGRSELRATLINAHEHDLWTRCTCS